MSLRVIDLEAIYAILEKSCRPIRGGTTQL